MNIDLDKLSSKIETESLWVKDIRSNIKNYLVGQERLVDRLLISLIINGHVLLEGVPGLAKTLALKTLSSLVNADFSRVQFTPDMLPADIIGTEVYNPKDLKFDVKHGPVFTNFLLADEINRAPAKVQSALLEAMQERQVTIGEQTFKLKEPFLVMATQNPIEQEGTYPLPEAQLDRFVMKITVDYPSFDEEKEILDIFSDTREMELPKSIVDVSKVLESKKLVNSIYIDEKVKDYIVSIVFATRFPDKYKLDLSPYIRMGASPRASIGLLLTAKAHAFINGRAYVTPNDVKSIANEVLGHRVSLSYEADAEGLTKDNIINKILSTLPVP